MSFQPPDRDPYASVQDVIAPGEACPRCGEQDPDRLESADGEHVTCQTCGTFYRAGE